MHIKQLDVQMSQTADRQPLAVVRNFPGLDAELTPEQLRRLARVLKAVADECEVAPMDAKHFYAYDRSFNLCD